MHEEGKVCRMVYKDKQAVRLLSTYAKPILATSTKPFVSRKIGGKKKKVCTSPMHLEYTRNMKGVDVTDQLWGVYSCLTWSHKWWHNLFFYMQDTTISNMWIIYSDLSFWFLHDPLTHQCFQLQLANGLGCNKGFPSSLHTFSQRMAQKAGIKSKEIVIFVASIQINGALVAKGTFVRFLAIGTIISD